jgi:hypothetical protein
MELKMITIPFFLGRWVSYSFWTFTAASIARKITLENTEAFSYLSAYFVASQICLLSIVYAFTRVDWGYLASEKKFRWLPRNKKPPTRM